LSSPLKNWEKKWQIKKMRKVGAIKKTARLSLANPSTTYGQQVNTTLLVHIRRQAEEKEKRGSDKLTAKADRDSKSHDQAISDSLKWQDVVNNTTPDAWLDQLSKPELVICHRHLLKKNSTAKIADIVAILTPFWNRDRAVLHNQGMIIDI
jgi:hypothetical protein